jgi:hypothetical protein
VINSQAAGQSLTLQPVVSSVRRSLLGREVTLEREPAASVATDSCMSIEFLCLGLDGRSHGVDRGVGGILQELLELHAILVDEVARQQVA